MPYLLIFILIYCIREMRIISGKWRGKIIQAPENLPVRPTTDMAKESLFNWMSTRIDLEDARVLDLFAGTGNITYELLSRGAGRILSVDKDPGCVKFIKRMSDQLLPGVVEVFQTDARVAIQRSLQPFRLIFADPPYDYPDHERITQEILSLNLLEEDGWFILEHPGSVILSHIPGYYETRHYGKVHFSFFQQIPALKIV